MFSGSYKLYRPQHLTMNEYVNIGTYSFYDAPYSRHSYG